MTLTEKLTKWELALKNNPQIKALWNELVTHAKADEAALKKWLGIEEAAVKDEAAEVKTATTDAEKAAATDLAK